MASIAEEGGPQLFLPPDSTGHYVGPEGPHRFIDVVGDSFSFVHAESRRMEPRATGRRIPRAVVPVSADTLL
ncbi:MAG: hypothetical protein OXJ55_18065 [Caldilineaceae bacterium]|nr:hypothetical protein [Caldilineaceae bacterium]